VYVKRQYDLEIKLEPCRQLANTVRLSIYSKPSFTAPKTGLAYYMQFLAPERKNLHKVSKV